MTVTQPSRRRSAPGSADFALAAPRWGWPQYLALLGVPILAWEIWTVVAWLADGPELVTEFRDRSSASWYAARFFEALAVVVAFAVIGYLIRGCRRQGRILTFDVMFCLAGASLFWLNVGVNFFLPTVLISSNFVGFENPCGHMPLVVNPDCGRVPDALPFFFLVETFGLLGLAIVAEGLLRRVKTRRPGISKRQLLGLVFLGAFIVDIVLEGFVMIPLGLWTYMAPEWMSIPLGGGGALRLPILEIIAGTLWFGLYVAVRIFKNDQGQTVVERGLQRYSPRRRTAITFLALYSVFQLTFIIPGSLPVVLYGPYEPAWPSIPRHLLNDVCDAPGVQGTRYGACPGSPSFRMPGRHSLPGESP